MLGHQDMRTGQGTQHQVQKFCGPVKRHLAPL
jgi:hypothetical protein